MKFILADPGPHESAELKVLITDFERAQDQLRRLTLSQIETALRNAIATREGDGYWTPEALARHCCRICYPQGKGDDWRMLEEYTWKGVPILRVERNPDPMQFGLIVTELQPL